MAKIFECAQALRAQARRFYGTLRSMLWSFAQSEATTFSILFRTHSLRAIFSASAHRWKIFVSVMLSPTVKSLSQTRWSESADAAEALRLVQSRNDWMPIPCGAKFVWVFA